MFTSKEDILRELHHQSNLGNTFATINWTQSKRKIAGDSESSSRQPTEYLVTMWHCDTVTLWQCVCMTQVTCDPSQPSLSIMLSGQGSGCHPDYCWWSVYQLSFPQPQVWPHVMSCCCTDKWSKLGNHYYPAFIWSGWAESRAVSIWWHSYLDWSVLTWRMQNNWRNNDQLLTNTPEDCHNYLLSGVKQLTLVTHKLGTGKYIFTFSIYFPGSEVKFQAWLMICLSVTLSKGGGSASDSLIFYSQRVYFFYRGWDRSSAQH